MVGGKGRQRKLSAIAHGWWEGGNKDKDKTALRLKGKEFSSSGGVGSVGVLYCLSQSRRGRTDWLRFQGEESCSAQ